MASGRLSLTKMARFAGCLSKMLRVRLKVSVTSMERGPAVTRLFLKNWLRSLMSKSNESTTLMKVVRIRGATSNLTVAVMMGRDAWSAGAGGAGGVAVGSVAGGGGASEVVKSFVNSASRISTSGLVCVVPVDDVALGGRGMSTARP